MDKMTEIRQRWNRMSQWRYNLGRMEAKDVEMDAKHGPILVLYSDRKPPEGSPDGTVSAMICGPLRDHDTLEDAIAYQEAPDDVRFLLGQITGLQIQLEEALKLAADSYGHGYSDGERGLDNANEVAKL